MNVYRPFEVEAHHGEDVTVECVAIGLPQPVVSWEKYGGILPTDRAEVIQGISKSYFPVINSWSLHHSPPKNTC